MTALHDNIYDCTALHDCSDKPSLRAQAMFTLATWLNNGRGGSEDHQVAFEWHAEAAAKGHPLAMFNTGYHYLMGKGVTQASVHGLTFSGS